MEILGVACEQALLNVVEMRKKKAVQYLKTCWIYLPTWRNVLLKSKKKSQLPIEYKKKLEQRLDELLTQPVDMIDERIAIELHCLQTNAILTRRLQGLTAT